MKNALYYIPILVLYILCGSPYRLAAQEEPNVFLVNANNSNQSCQADTITFIASGDEGLLFEFFVDGVSQGEPSEDNRFLTNTIGEGFHEVEVAGIDEQGNIGLSDVIEVEVLPKTPVSIIWPEQNTFTDARDTVILIGDPEGGVFSGTGVLGNTFNPSFVGSELSPYNVTYSYEAENGCISETSIQMSVLDNATAIAGVETQYCQNAPNDTILVAESPLENTLLSKLEGMSSQGNRGVAVWEDEEGEVLGYVFEPSVLSDGVYSLRATYTNTLTGEITTRIQDVRVLPLPEVSFEGLQESYCLGEDEGFPEGLFGFPADGVFTGPGISDSGVGAASFDISEAGVGTHIIQYEVSSLEGCSAVSTQEVTVNDIPEVTVSGLDATYCYNADTIRLLANVAGGVFSGAGIMNAGSDTAQFLPAQAVEDVLFPEDSDEFQASEFTIEYAYTDSKGCSNTAQLTTTILPLPSVDFDEENGREELCVADSVINLFGFNIENGVGQFSGPGITNTADNTGTLNIKDAFSQLGVTNSYIADTEVPIAYTYTDVEGCTNVETENFLIYKQTAVSIVGLNDSSTYCYGGSEIILSSSVPSDEISTFTQFSFTDDRDGDFVWYPLEDGSYFFSIYDAVEDGTEKETNKYPITMTYYDSVNCPNVVFDTITIRPVPEVELNGLELFGSYCYDTTAIILEGMPAGGQFLGNGLTTMDGSNTAQYRTALDAIALGVDNPSFNGPPIASKVEYTYTNEFGCTAGAETYFDIRALPNVDIGGLDDFYCIDEDPGELRGIPPPSGGGNDGGFGVFMSDIVQRGDGGWFIIPELLELNGQTLTDTLLAPITYAYTDGFGCYNTFTDTTVIRPRPVAAYTVNGDPNLREFCNGDPTVNLSIVPAVDESTLGAFIGAGVNDPDQEDGNGTFSPSIAYDDYLQNNPNDTAAFIELTYAYEDSFGCVSMLSDTLIVHPLPTLTITGQNQAESYCFADSPFELLGAPLGGRFSGAGIVMQDNGAARYSPRAAFMNLGLDSLGDTGLDRVVYTYTNANGCTDSTEISLGLKPIPPINNFNDQSSCFGDTLLLEPRPNASAANGLYQFSGAGIVDLGDGTAQVITAVAAAANGVTSANDTTTRQLVTYRYTNAIGCSNIANAVITIHPYTQASLVYENQGVNNSFEYCNQDASFEVNANTDVALQSLAITGSGVVTDEQGKYNFVPTVARQDAISSNPNLATSQTQHIINLTYTNVFGCISRDTDTLKINPLPSVNFGVSSNCIEDVTLFTDSTSTEGVELTDWVWNFGDATIDSTQNPIHQYGVSGVYEVKLTVLTEAGCSNEHIKSVVIGDKPTARFSLTKICVGDTTLFNGGASSVGNSQLDEITSWNWNFGDPSGITIDTALTATKHVFSAVNPYQVSLVVETNNGCRDTVRRNLSVLPSIDASSLNDRTPYLENFEENNGGWGTAGINNSWEWGIPADNAGINAAASGQRAWVTNLTGSYNVEEISVVNGPCLDFSELNRPMISMKLWSDSDSTRDGAVLQYSLNDGSSWVNIGDLNSPYNWYDAGVRSQPGGNSVGLPAWTGSYEGWRTARHTLDALKGQKRVRFRIAFASDLSIDDRGGFAFDEVWIGNRFKRVLIERFTNSSSNIDVAANSNLNNLIEELGTDDIVALQYHTASDNGEPSDPINLSNPFDPSARQLFYGVTGTPRTVIDGEVSATLSTSEITERILGDESLLGFVPFNVEIDFEENPSNSLNIRTTVQANQDISESVILQVAVIERTITQVTGANGETTFEWSVRKLLPNAAGTAFTRQWTAGDTEVVSQSWELQNIYDPNQVEVIAFVQQNNSNEEGVRQVYQTAYAVPSVVPDIVTALEDVPEAFQKVTVYPNPTAKTTYVLLNQPVKAPTSWTVHNLTGKQVAEGVIPRGSNGVSIDASDLPRGVYLIRGIQEGKLVMSEKLIVK